MSNVIITMIRVYETNCLIESRSVICASLFGSTMSNLVDAMTRDFLDTNIIIHDINLIIMIPILLCLCIMDFIN